jgi:uncharacterized membrane protein
MTTLSRALFLAILLTSTLALAQGTYTQFDVPGAVQTMAFGVNTQGDISGLYFDGFKYHGFLLRDGTYTTIDYPGASGTYAYGINDLDQVVGTTESSPFSGFVYDASTQTYTQVTCNGTFTTPFAINNVGVIAGFDGDDGQYAVGFELVGSTCRFVQPVKTLEAYLFGVTASNEAVGSVGTREGALVSNYSYKRGTSRKLTVPGAPGAGVTGISPSGEVLVGNYFPSTGVEAGFVYENGTLTTLLFPGSMLTLAGGVNSGGEVAGGFTDAIGMQHGFTWTPSAPAETK